jgi:peptidyl-prolyl cis-trans isomerase SurA
MPDLLSRIWFIPLLAAGLLLVPARTPAAAPAAAVDRILIVVNDDIITAREVEMRLASIRRRLAAQQVNLPPEPVLRRQVMDHMVMERLQAQAARNLGLKVSETHLEDAIQQIAKRQGVTPEQYKQSMQAEPGGYPLFRQELGNQLLAQQLTEREIHNRLAVTEAEVEQFLANQAGREAGVEYRISHILIAVPESASPEKIAEARRQAEAVHAELDKGADFKQLAVAHSQGQNALEGGSLGWKAGGQLPDLFVEALRELQPGRFSKVLRSPNGFHLLRLDDRRGGGAAVNVTQTQVRHILIRINELVNAREAERRAAQLRERLVNGEDFAAAARSNSDDVASAANGGELGWVNPGQLVPEFEKVMNALQPGELSQPVRSPFGVHLIQVQSRRERDISHERELASARQQILSRKADERQQQWLRQLRDEAYVEYKLDNQP